jgi:hypothetical protein
MPTSFANPNGGFQSESSGGRVTVVAPLTGATVTMQAADEALYLDLAGTIAALTIVLLKAPYAGQIVEIGYNHTVSALTLHDGFGNAITGAPTSLTAGGGAVVMRYIGPPPLSYTAVGWVVWK